MKEIRENGEVAEMITYLDLSYGTSLQGYVTVTYERLVATFGIETYDGDCDKVDAEWEIMTPAGIATIYNYKDGKNYNGVHGKAKENITDWHIGGKNKDVVKYVLKALKQ